MVAVHSSGSIACGTSTNGATFKIPGRVGDSPISGSGAYCDDTVGAAAATGDGDVMMRFLPSFYAVSLMASGASPASACEATLHMLNARLMRLGLERWEGALVCVDRWGRHGGAQHNMPYFRYTIASDATKGAVQTLEGRAV